MRQHQSARSRTESSKPARPTGGGVDELLEHSRKGPDGDAPAESGAPGSRVVEQRGAKLSAVVSERLPAEPERYCTTEELILGQLEDLRARQSRADELLEQVARDTSYSAGLLRTAKRRHDAEKASSKAPKASPRKKSSRGSRK